MERIDILNRNADVERLQNIIQIVSEKKANTSFAINGGWGSGKSFVLNMLEESLEQIQSDETATNRYLIFHYDSWKYDYYEEPILAIVASMLDTLDEKINVLPEKQRETIKATLKVIGNAFLNIANTVVEAKTGIDFKDTVDSAKQICKSVKKGINDNHDFDIYFSFNKTLNDLRKAIQGLSVNHTIVFVVDELDRCLPAYAIKVLERLHHITNEVMNTVTIIATDKDRLETIIQNSIGVKEVDAYLKKFIKFEIALDHGKTNSDIEKKFSSYFSLFEGKNKDEVLEYIHAIFQNIDIRSVTQIIDFAELVHGILADKKMGYTVMCMELLIIVLVKYYNLAFPNNQEVEINNNNFLLTTKTNNWKPEARPMLEFFDSKSNSGYWSTVMISHKTYKRIMVVHDTSSLYEVLCYFYSLIVGGNNVRYDCNIIVNNEKPSMMIEGEFIKDYMNFLRLIN